VCKVRSDTASRMHNHTDDLKNATRSRFDDRMPGRGDVAGLCPACKRQSLSLAQLSCKSS